MLNSHRAILINKLINHRIEVQRLVNTLDLFIEGPFAYAETLSAADEIIQSASNLIHKVEELTDSITQQHDKPKFKPVTYDPRKYRG